VGSASGILGRSPRGSRCQHIAGQGEGQGGRQIASQRAVQTLPPRAAETGGRGKLDFANS
jgi:hypothetical protein